MDELTLELHKIISELFGRYTSDWDGRDLFVDYNYEEERNFESEFNERYYHIINNKRCMTDVNFYKWLVTHHLIEIGYVEQAVWDFETALKRFFGEE